MLTMFELLLISFFVLLVSIGCFCVFFDQAILTRRDTIFRVKTNEKKIALTFDDGPSDKWTPLILDELKKAGLKATFFMIGHHVKKYPNIAQRVNREGHVIGNHTYAHSVIFYYKDAELEEEIRYTEQVIREITGVTTNLFRPPKAWISNQLKKQVKSMGYKVVLWSLNSKDWTYFSAKQMANHLIKNVKSGDILLFHDSGNVLSAEGGDRSRTVQALQLLIRALKEDGFSFVTVNELISNNE